MTKNMPSLISFVRIRNEEETRKGIQDALGLIRYKLPTNMKNIAIKPNMCYYWDHTTGQTTDPKFVASLIELIREQTSTDVNISIVESDASAMKCEYAFRFLGYEKMAKQHQVELVNLSTEASEPVKLKVNKEKFDLMIPKTIKNADLLINVPKVKYLAHTKISCALKNVFGCNPYPKKFEYHSRLDETIVALNKIIRFDLCIVDGIIVSGSRPCKLGLLMASRDPVAVDTAAAIIAGVDPKSVRHIMLAASHDIGSTSFTAKGMDLRFFEERYPKRSLTSKFMTVGYRFIELLGLEKRVEYWRS